MKISQVQERLQSKMNIFRIKNEANQKRKENESRNKSIANRKSSIKVAKKKLAFSCLSSNTFPKLGCIRLFNAIRRLLNKP